MTGTPKDLKLIAAEWREARRVYPVYLGIAQRFSLPAEPLPELECPIDRPEPEALAAVRGWLDRADGLVEVHQLRLFLQTGPPADERVLRALSKRVLNREAHDSAQRDKADFLLVQYFAQCAPQGVVEGEPTPADVAAVLRPLLGEVPTQFPGWLEPLDDALRRLRLCLTLRELLGHGILQEVRQIKVAASEAYFTPAALVAFTRYNFLIRQAFFRLMRADLEAVREAVRRLEAHGVSRVDCRKAELSAEEPTARVLETCAQWRKPFQAEYSAGYAFAQLSELRAAVDAALAQHGLPPVENVVPVYATAAAAQSAVAAASASGMQKVLATKSSAPARAGMAGEVERIIQHLSSDLAARLDGSATDGTMVVVDKAPLTLSAWEVRAFVEDIGDYRRLTQHAVATRALLAQEVERARSRGEQSVAGDTVALTELQARRLQAAIEEAQDSRDIEAAVMLAATLQRLNALLDQARGTLE